MAGPKKAESALCVRCGKRKYWSDLKHVKGGPVCRDADGCQLRRRTQGTAF